MSAEVYRGESTVILTSIYTKHNTTKSLPVKPLHLLSDKKKL